MNSAKQSPQYRFGPAFGVVGVILAVIFAVIWFNLGQEPAPEHPEGAPNPDLAEARSWEVLLDTSMGPIEFSLDGKLAPTAAASFIHLAREGFFDGTTCHRLLPSSLLQCGDPTGSGNGGPEYSFGPIENAPSDNMYRAGTVAMARVSGNAYSMGSQFFLVFEDVFLPADRAGGYTVMGTIEAGLPILKEVAEAGTVDGSMDAAPLTRVIIESVEVK